jgi:O-antigen ligase
LSDTYASTAFGMAAALLIAFLLFGTSAGLAGGIVIVAVGLILFSLPGVISQAAGHLQRLTNSYDASLAPWILVFLSGLVFRTRASREINAEPLDAWALFRIGLVTLAFLILLMRFVNGKWAGSVFRGVPGILAAFGLFGVLSTSWSAFPSWTLYKSVEFLIDVVVLVSVVSTINTPEQCRRFFDWTWMMLLALLATVWAGAFIWPDDALERGVGLLGIQLSGVYPEVAANGVGELAGVLALVSMIRLVYSRNKAAYASVLACCLATLVFSQTRSALGAFFCGSLFILIGRKRIGSAFLAAVCAAVFLSSTSSGVFWKFVERGQDKEMFTSLSGRTTWWTAALERFKERPVLGYGNYTGGRFIILEESQPAASSVHNDYLEVALGVGVAGLLIAVAAVVVTWSRIARAVRSSRDGTLRGQLAVEALAVLAFITTRSMFSTVLFWHPPVLFFLVVAYAEVASRRRAYEFAGRRIIPTRSPRPCVLETR